MTDNSPIVCEKISYAYGSGELRKQILFDVSIEIRAGEIMILTGPSGSGKTTLLTLMGALRAGQEGSLRIFGQQLSGARERTLVQVRRRIGYIFQSYNLIPQGFSLPIPVALSQMIGGIRDSNRHGMPILWGQGMI